MARTVKDQYSPGLASRLAADQSGVAAVITGFALVTLLGFAGIGIDIAKWLGESRSVQSAADKGAYSAAAAAATSACPDQTATAQARAVIASRGYIDGQNGAAVNIGCDATNSTYTVHITQAQPLWFSRLFLSTPPTVSGRATAQLAGTQSDLCILALDGTNFYEGVIGNHASAFWLNGNTTVNVQCGVAVDSSNVAALSTGGSSQLIATSIYLVGDHQGSPSGSSVLATSPTANNILKNQRPVADPYAGRVVPSYGCSSYTQRQFPPAGAPGTTFELTTSSSMGGTAPAGTAVFCGGLDLGENSGQRKTINIQPGVYVVAGNAGGGLRINAKADIRTPNGGVTFILTGNSSQGYARVTVNGQSTMELAAPVTGPYGGMAFFQDRSAPPPTTNGGTSSCGGGNTQNQMAGGNTQLITGALYFPSQSLCYGGGSSTSGAGKCTQLIAYTLSFTGNTTIRSNCAGTGIDPISVTKPQLIQ